MCVCAVLCVLVVDIETSHHQILFHLPLPPPPKMATDAELKPFKDFLLNYNKLSEMCFMDCVQDFTFREVSKREETCAENCFEKFLKLNNRISQRFQEIQLAQQDKTMAQPN